MGAGNEPAPLLDSSRLQQQVQSFDGTHAQPLVADALKGCALVRTCQRSFRNRPQALLEAGGTWV